MSSRKNTRQQVIQLRFAALDQHSEKCGNSPSSEGAQLVRARQPTALYVLSTCFQHAHALVVFGRRGATSSTGACVLHTAEDTESFKATLTPTEQCLPGLTGEPDPESMSEHNKAGQKDKLQG